MRALAVVIGLLGVIQLVPYGRDHESPAVIAEPTWPAHPEARLTEAEQQAFIRGLVDTFGDEKEGGSGHD